MHSRTYKPISRSRQDLDTTSLYPANIRSGGSWVRGKKGHGLAGERGEKTYFRVLAQALSEEISYWDDMPSKRSKDELEPLGACHER